MKSDEYIGSIK